jgi:hypothetical protein
MGSDGFNDPRWQVPSRLNAEPTTHVKLIFDTEMPSLEELLKRGPKLWEIQTQRYHRRDLTLMWDFAEIMLGRKTHTALRGPNKGKTFQRPSEQVLTALQAHHLIQMDALVPTWWNVTKSGSFPYNSLFIAAFYLIEAQRLFKEAKHTDAWQSTVQAFYFLGQASSEKTTSESAASAATSRHTNASQEMRSIVLAILEQAREDKTIKTKTDAIRKVKIAIELDNDYRDALKRFDVSKGSKESTTGTEFDRLEAQLKSWSKRDSPYGEIAEAMRSFTRKKKQSAT